ncbi:Qat anti-phage system ATPase QatA [Larkinella punicea]|uniref:KAP NTPase domain-containing protein n=1 Tax=Larkinella punicea TaxID=2315727 RepID=A0A368JLK9_9BACT|nr:Qat anti-phage system ATPase QatA [Larkinella punicea]RCR67021.1 hypothetical protein DUE52_23475 [Larkinella punicea]
MWNDKESTIDFLGHAKIAQTITSIIEEQHLRPLTIGVYGDWGAGKSSVLSFIQAQFEGDSTVLAVTFNGWLFQGYEDTKSALMESIVSELVRHQPKNQKVLSLGKKLLAKINWFKVAKAGAGAMMSLAATAATAALVPEAAPVVAGHGALSFIANLFAGKKQEKDSKEDKQGKEIDYEEFIRDEINGTVPGLFHQFRSEFKQLIQTANVEKLVVLVDDLDRCLPTTIIEILEAIRLFLFVEGTVFVLSADENLIEYAVRKHFPDLPIDRTEYTRNYLEKLVQIPIRIPSLNRLQTSNYIGFLLLQNHLQAEAETLSLIAAKFESSKKTPFDNVVLDSKLIEDALGHEAPEIRTVIAIAGQLGNVLADGLKGNPRNIKRFLNTLFLRMRIAKISGIGKLVELDMLAKLMILERFYSQQFQVVMDESLAAEDGKSKSVAAVEALIGESDSKSTAAKKQAKKQGEDANAFNEDLYKWASLKPALGMIDLRPYIFISREKTISFGSDQELPKKLSDLLTMLSTGNRLTLAQVEPILKGLQPAESKVISNRLLDELRHNTGWASSPPILDGLLKLNSHFSEEARELEILSLLESINPGELKAWVVFKLDELTSSTAQAKVATMKQNWLQSTEVNETFKKLIHGRKKTTKPLK